MGQRKRCDKAISEEALTRWAMGSHASRASLGWELTGKLAEAFSLPKFVFPMEVSGLSLLQPP